MPDDTRPKFMGAKEFANHLGMHRQTLYVKLQEGKIPGARKVGDRWKIPRRALEEVGQPAEVTA